MIKSDVSISSFFLGVLVGGVLMAFSFHSHFSENEDDMRRDVAAYDECMRQAGRMRCHMSPRDFLRYFELKDKLRTADYEACDGAS